MPISGGNSPPAFVVLLRDAVALVLLMPRSTALSVCCFESRDVSVLPTFLKAGSQGIS